jgi:hypothetical protein
MIHWKCKNKSSSIPTMISKMTTPLSPSPPPKTFTLKVKLSNHINITIKKLTKNHLLSAKNHYVNWSNYKIDMIKKTLQKINKQMKIKIKKLTNFPTLTTSVRKYPTTTPQNQLCNSNSLSQKKIEIVHLSLHSFLIYYI